MDESTPESLARALHKGRRLRVVGFDDAPFDKSDADTPVLVNGVVCSGIRFEGMVSTTVTKDGWDATDRVVESLADSKFLPQLHLILFDGIAFGGFNVIDLAAIHDELGLPSVAVVRSAPDFARIEAALANLPRPDERMARMRQAGEVYEATDCFFQVVGADPTDVADALGELTDHGHLPEAIRIAHLVGSAIVTGESGRRA